MTDIAFGGNITSPAELRFTQGGKPVASVTVAVNRKRGDQEATDFHRVTLWDSLATHSAELDKGTRVVVVGRLESRDYEAKDGQKRTVWEVTAFGFGPDLRFASVQVTRAERQQQSSNTWDAAQQSEPWGGDDASTPF